MKKSTKTLSLILFVCMICAVFMFNLNYGNNVYAGETNTYTMTNVYSEGNYDSEVRSVDEVTISSVTEMLYFVDYVNEGHTPTDLTFVLISDIDLSSVCNENAGNWTPIGTSANKFDGEFSGDKYIISGLYFNSTDDNVVAGLFGYTNYSYIKDTIVTGSITATGNNCTVGGVVANCEGRISNCTNECVIEVGQNGNVGGICGISNNTINSCRNIGNVEGGDGTYIGGIVGKIMADNTIYNSYNLASITGDEQHVGGIFGTNEVADISAVSAENCYNMGSIEDINNGAICGVLSTNTAINHCYYSFEEISAFGSINGSYTNCEAFVENFELYNEVTINSVQYDNLIEALNAWVENEDSSYNGEWEYRDGEIACMSCVKMYKISYLANGGLGTIDDEYHIRGLQFSIKNANDFTKIGAMFTGWATEQGGEVEYLPADSISLTNNSNLYATWHEIRDGADGSDGVNGIDASITLAIISIIVAALSLVANGVMLYFFVIKKSKIKK